MRSEGTVLATVLLRVIRIAVLASSQALSLVGPHRDSLIDQGMSGPHFPLFVFCVCQLRIYGVQWQPEDIWNLWKEMPVLRLRTILIHISMRSCTVLCWCFNHFFFPIWPSVLSVSSWHFACSVVTVFSEPNLYKSLTLQILVPVLCRFWPFRGIPPNPRPCVAFRKVLSFYCERLFVSLPTQDTFQARVPPLVGCPQPLFHYICSCVSWGLVTSRWRGFHLTGLLPAMTLKWPGEKPTFVCRAVPLLPPGLRGLACNWEQGQLYLHRNTAKVPSAGAKSLA